MYSRMRLLWLGGRLFLQTARRLAWAIANFAGGTASFAGGMAALVGDIAIFGLRAWLLLQEA